MWLWIVLAAAFLAELFFVEIAEIGFMATVVLLAALGVSEFLFHVPIFEWIRANPMLIVVGGVVYIIVGVIWSFVKWASYCRKRAIDYKRRGWPIAKGDLLVDSHKGDIIRWITYWPFSLLITFIDDPIRRFFNGLFEMLKLHYQNIATSMAEKYGQVPKDR